MSPNNWGGGGLCLGLPFVLEHHQWGGEVRHHLHRMPRLWAVEVAYLDGTGRSGWAKGGRLLAVLGGWEKREETCLPTHLLPAFFPKKIKIDQTGKSANFSFPFPFPLPFPLSFSPLFSARGNQHVEPRVQVMNDVMSALFDLGCSRTYLSRSRQNCQTLNVVHFFISAYHVLPAWQLYFTQNISRSSRLFFKKKK